jgi:hypothetical protein
MVRRGASIGTLAAATAVAHVGSFPRTDDMPTRLPGSPAETIVPGKTVCREVRVWTL